MTQHITDSTFEETVIQSKIPVLLDFWAPWCGPCRTIGPVLESLSEELEGKVLIVKLNVDENPITASNFQVRSIPTLIFFKDGEKVEQISGAVAKDAIKDAFVKLGFI